MTSAYYIGYYAWFIGDENPFRDGSSEHAEWQRGYDFAEAEQCATPYPPAS